MSIPSNDPPATSSDSPSASASLPKERRLRKPSEFRRVFDGRASAADGTLIVYATPNQLDVTRLGLVVSRKVGRAVLRNRWKRLIREAFRHSVALPTGFDLVVLPRATARPRLATISHSLERLAAQAARRSHGRRK